MPTAKVLDMTGKQLGEIELPVSVFGIDPSESAIHASVINYLANQRQGNQSTLTRAEVSGGGRKPWRQKGTGRARQGSTRSPQWTHGGIALGPKPRSYNYSINRKLKKLALKSALSSKAAADEIIVIEGLALAQAKTKEFAKFLKAVDAPSKSLVITPDVNTDIVRSARNIQGANVTYATAINTYSVLNCVKVIIDKAAIALIEEVYA